MVSLSVGHYGALRYRYSDMKALDSSKTVQFSDAISPASDTRYQIYTPWITRAGAPRADLKPEDRLHSQFVLPMTRKDVSKRHEYEIRWDTHIFDPLDQRTKCVPSKPTAEGPVPCPPTLGAPVVPRPELIYTARLPPRKYGTAMALRSAPFESTPSTRSEEWSTLRQILPSKGPVVVKRPAENWGTGNDTPPRYAGNPIEAARAAEDQSFRRINSAMSRFAHDSYFHDSLFKMF